MTSRHVVDHVVLPTGCPITDRERRNFEIHVTLRGEDPASASWAVLKHFYLRLNAVTGEWDRESIPSARRDKWIAEHSFTIEDALTAAETIVDEHDENGANYATWAAFRDGRSPHRNDPDKRNSHRTGRLA